MRLTYFVLVSSLILAVPPVGIAGHALGNTLSANLSGARTGQAYAALEQLPSQIVTAAGTCASGECSSIPANEWIWAEILLRDSQGQPIPNELVGVNYCYDDCKGNYLVSEYTNATGQVRRLLPPALAGQSTTTLTLVDTMGDYNSLDYQIGTPLPPDPRLSRLEPTNEWDRFNLTIPSPGYYVILLNSARFPTFAQAESSEGFDKAQAVFTDVKLTVRGHSSRQTAYTIGAQDEGATVSVGEGAIQQEESTPIVSIPPGTDSGYAVWLQGYFEPGDVAFTGVIAHAGRVGEPVFGIDFFSTNGTTVGGISIEDHGSFQVTPPQPRGTHAVATVGGFGARAGDFQAKASVPNGVVIAGGATDIVGQATLTIAHGDQTLQRNLGSSKQFSIVRQGLCNGPWTVNLTTSVNVLSTSYVVLANGENMTISDFAQRVYTVPTDCSLQG